MSEQIRVGVSGARGKLGSPIVAALNASDEFEVVATKGRDDSVDVLNNCDVVLDVSVADATRETFSWCAEHGINVVCGTTGLSDDELTQFDPVFRANNARCFVVPNFSIGANLLMSFAEHAAKYMAGVEIIELHHNQKLDAPSGTARLTAKRIAAARVANNAAESGEHAARGELIDGVRVHSVRLPGLVAHEEVIFGDTAQTLTIRHDSFSRESFVDGALLALRKVATLQPGVTQGLSAVLDI